MWNVSEWTNNGVDSEKQLEMLELKLYYDFK